MRLRISKWAPYILMVVIMILGVSPFFRPFNYTFSKKIHIPSDTNNMLKGSDPADNIRIKLNGSQIDILKEMRESGQLLTADEFASRITSYYDILVGALGTLFIVFTFSTYFSMKYTFEKKFDDKANEIDDKDKGFKKVLEKKMEDFKKDLKEKMREELKDLLRDSRQARAEIVEAVTGHVEENLVSREDFEAISNVMEDFERKQKDIITELSNLQELSSKKISVTMQTKKARRKNNGNSGNKTD